MTMKFLRFLLLCALFLCGTCTAAIAVVQVSPPALFPNGTAGSTATASLSGVASGDSLIALVFGGDGSFSSHTISVSDGTSYTADVEQNQFTSGSVYTQAAIFHRHNVSSGSYSIVATNGAGTFSSYGVLVVLEVSGLANANPNATNVNSSTSGSPSVGPGTPTNANSIAIGVSAIVGANANPITLSSPSGYTNAAIQLNGTLTGQFCGSADYLIQTSAVATTPTWTSSGNAEWSTVQAIFEGTGGGGGGGANGQMMLRGIGKAALRAGPQLLVVAR